MRHFHYKEPGGSIVIRIVAGRKPGPNTKPSRGTWVVRELLPDLPGSSIGKWQMPAFPEITWGILKDMEYLGSVECEWKDSRENRS